MSSSSSPCAACKFLRRKCTQDCVFAPYFSPDQPQRFTSVHKVYGASNVAKLLNELPSEHREAAVKTLVYEADARLQDSVYGCVGMISLMQQRLKQVHTELYSAKKELSNYIGDSALLPMVPPPFPDPAAALQQHYNMSPLMGVPTGIAAGLSIAGPSNAGPSHAGSSRAGGGGTQLMIREPQPQQHQQPQNQQYLDAQQFAALAVSDDQDFVRNWEKQQHQLHQQQLEQFMRFHGSGFGGHEGTVVVGGSSGVSDSVEGGFNQAGSTSASALPSLALGASSSFDQTGHEQQIQPQQPPQPPQLQDGSLGQLLHLQQSATPQVQQQQQLGLGDIAPQGTPHHHEHNHQQQGLSSQSHHHQNLLLQLQHQHEHIQPQ